MMAQHAVDRFVEDRPAHRRTDDLRAGLVLTLAVDGHGRWHAQLDHRLQVDHTDVVGELGVVEIGERLVLAAGALPRSGEVVDTQHHVQRRGDDRVAIGRLEQVVDAQHLFARFALGRRGQRHVNGHLVAVEVGIERRTHQRMDLDRAALDQYRLERLDTQAVQRRGAVQQDRVVLNDLFEHVPDFGAHPLDDAFCRLDVVRQALLHELAHHERLEQLERHALRQTALVQLQRRTNHDDRTARVVDALAQQVLAEAALLALEHVRQALELVVGRAADRPSAAAVVDQRIDRLLQHAFFIANDDLGSLQLQ